MATVDLVELVKALVPERGGEPVLASLAVQRTRPAADNGQAAAVALGGAVGGVAYQAARKGTIEQRKVVEQAMKELGIASTAMVWAVTPSRLLVLKASSMTQKPVGLVAAHRLEVVELVEVGTKKRRAPVTVRIQGLKVTVTSGGYGDVAEFGRVLGDAIDQRRPPGS